VSAGAGAGRLGPVAIGVVAAALLAIGLGARVFTNNDEARFPMLAADILVRGDWLWPRLNGAGYYNKPPLLAWLIALCSWPGGHVTQLTAVVPSVLAAIATVVLVYLIGRDLFGADAGRCAALVVATTQGLFEHAHLALPDALMTCFITASLWMLVRMAQGRPGPWWIGFYGLAGVAFWAKGPAGLLPLAVAFVYGAVTRSRRSWSLRLSTGLPLVGAAVGAWWLLGALSSSQALAHAVATDNLAWYRPQGRSLSAVTAPLRNAFAVLFPWVLLVPFALAAAFRASEEGGERDRLRLLLLWAGVITVLVGLSNQQRLRYYLPLVAPVALLVGWWLRGPAGKPRRIGRIPWRLSLGAALVLIAATVASGRRVSWSLVRELPAPPLLIVALIGALAIIGAALLHGARHQWPPRAFAAMWIGSALWLVGTQQWELERDRRAGDYAHLASLVRPLLTDPGAVAAWGMPELPLAFYAARPVISVGSEVELRDVLAREPRATVLATAANWSRLDERDRFTLLTRARAASREVVVARDTTVRRPTGSGSLDRPL
jgi:4-amino-4-deoxy-L-arabinose transferase-like glycosyltransferase